MKYSVKYIDDVETIEEFEEGELVSISFFFSNSSFFSDKINVYRAYRISDNKEIELKDYKRRQPPFGEERISFIMPGCDIYLKRFEEVDNSRGYLSIDTSNIKESLFKNDYDQESYVTDARFSDDYDFGLKDHEFSSLPHSYKFFYGSKLKVVLMLTKDIIISLHLSGKKYQYKSKEEFIDNCKGIKVFKYTFTDVEFVKDDFIKFKIK